MKINILTSYDYLSYFFFYPLLVNTDRLRGLNTFVNYYDKISDQIFYCDILFLDSKYFRPFWKDFDRALLELRKIRDKSIHVVWLDTTDSTGTTHFQVMPYVDQYWKKQILKDLDLYEKSYYGARIYTDYYKNNCPAGEEEVFSVQPLKKGDKEKIYASWNLGTGPVNLNRKIANCFRLTPWSIKKRIKHFYYFKKKIACMGKKSGICFRGTSRYVNNILSHQRKIIIEKMDALGIDTRPVPSAEYYKELKESLIGVSPFGAGEICVRDFEIVLEGTLLLKPSMDHVVTYPDIYIENETYVPFKWDFSDFEQIIHELIDDLAKIRKISLCSMQKYADFFSSDGQEQFCIRFHSKCADLLTSSRTTVFKTDTAV